MTEHRSRLERWLPYLLATVAAVLYASISIYRYEHFGSNAFDLGVQDQTVWGYSRLQMIPNTVEMIRNLLGDHFHPILMMIAPLYWIWNDVRVLLIVQAVLLAVAGIPIFWWARQELGLRPALVLECAYFVFWGVLSGVVFDFHHIVFAIPAVSFALYAVLTGKNRLFLGMLAIGLLTRENVALTFAAIGVYVLLVQRRWRLALPVIAVCIGWFAIVLEVVMPAIAGIPYSHWYYQQLGSGPGAALWHILRHPFSSVAILFDNADKLKLWAGVLASWLLLPLLSPLALVALPNLLERLWSNQPTLWSASYDYSMLLGPILAFSTIDALRRVRPWLPRNLGRLVPLAGSVATCLCGAFVTFAIVQPLAELRTYISGSAAASIQSCLDVIPPAASVSASNYLLPHLSHRPQIYLLTMKDDADYIAIDLATDRSRNLSGEQAWIRGIVDGALARGYGVACSRGTTVILEDGGGNKTLSGQFAALIHAG